MKSQKQLDLEEALGVIWSKKEKGISDEITLRTILKAGVSECIFEELVKDALIKLDSGKVCFTPEGEKTARDVTRRHRLAERLLVDVIDASKSEIENIACEFEHILSAEVADSICALLGHPKICPHGHAIPSGRCCRAAAGAVAPIVVKLSELEPGADARIVYFTSQNHSHTHKLMSLGIVPGKEIKLHQKFPSFVVDSGQTQIALDAETAEQIFVRKI